ncbi:MAG: FmdE family protein [Desulfatibacillaceae bacterium]
MACTFSDDVIQQTQAFHGHVCPGLAIGIRAAELALREVGHAAENDLVAVTETDMCGVDAVQFLTGATYGKGNLVHKDYGKMAFTFWDRAREKGVRAVFRWEAGEEFRREMYTLMRKIQDGEAADEEKKKAENLRQKLYEDILAAELDTLFTLHQPQGGPPTRARVLDSIQCARCGERTMESRTRRYDRKVYCIPCFEKVEQKL